MRQKTSNLSLLFFWFLNFVIAICAFKFKIIGNFKLLLCIYIRAHTNTHKQTQTEKRTRKPKSTYCY